MFSQKYPINQFTVFFSHYHVIVPIRVRSDHCAISPAIVRKLTRARKLTESFYGALQIRKSVSETDLSRRSRALSAARSAINHRVVTSDRESKLFIAKTRRRILPFVKNQQKKKKKKKKKKTKKEKKRKGRNEFDGKAIIRRLDRKRCTKIQFHVTEVRTRRKTLYPPQ